MKKFTLFIALLAMSVMSYALNPFAYGLSSQLSEDGAVLTVNYSLNAEATAVSVAILDGEEVVKSEDCSGLGLVAGAYTAEIVLADLPAGSYTWQVVVDGTSVAEPTEHAVNYSLYHPSSVDIDNNPENPTFGLVLTNEAMQSVASKTEGYISAGFGAGIYAFNPAFEPIANGDKPGFNGGKTFSTAKNDFAPRRVRFTEDGRIFATAQDGSGEYLWEINPANLDEWTTVFQGTNDGYALKDAEGNFIAGTNSGFDVRGEGESLQLLMLSASLPGGQVAKFQCHTYDLGTATTWATVPTKEIPGANYMLVTNQSNVQFDKDGGVWYIQYRGTTTETEPGLVHINKDGVEDYKELRNMTRNAGFRFNDDFTKVVIAGNNGSAKKGTIYAYSEDADGKPVLTEELVINMATVGSNLNDFAWDYAGNLYCCGNSSEKIVAWAMPYSGQVVTPAAAQYKFELAGSSEEEVVYEAFEMSNLSVTPMGTFELLEASDDMMGLSVVLGYVLADGSLMEGSAVSFMGQDLSILEGTITKSYSEELATDVYVAHLVVEFMGGKLGLELTMYAGAAEVVEVNIEDATVIVDETTGTLQFTATWSDGVETYPVSVTVAGYEDAEFKEYEGAQISELQIGGDGDNDPWLDFAVADAVAVFKDGNLVSLEGEYTSWATGTTYYVLAEGLMQGGENPEPEYEFYEDVITNMTFDLENMVIIGGPSENFQIDVYLVLGEDDGSGEFQLTEESSVAVMGSDATFIDGMAYEIDPYAPAALVDLVVEWNGNLYQFHLTMSAAPMEATVVVVENAVVEVEKYLLFGDTYDYSLKMTGEWVNEADGLTYPVLVEVPVYYPEATEPSEIMSTVTVGGWGDNDPWLGFGEGELTITTVGNTVTATGVVENPMAGVAIDITISGELKGDGTGVDNATVTVKAVKTIKNGQLIINRAGKEYNAQGAIVK